MYINFMNKQLSILMEQLTQLRKLKDFLSLEFGTLSCAIKEVAKQSRLILCLYIISISRTVALYTHF